MRVKATLKVIISEDDDQLANVDPDINVTIDDSTLLNEQGGTITLAGGAAETQFAFAPEVTNAKYVVVQVFSGEVTLKLNSNTAPAIGLKPNPAVAVDPILPYQKDAQPGLWFMGPLSAANPLTSLYIHNVSGTVAARIGIRITGEAV